MDIGSTNHVCELRARKVLEVAGTTAVRHFRSFTLWLGNAWLFRLLVGTLQQFSRAGS
jgi:hypothetical protein